MGLISLEPTRIHRINGRTLVPHHRVGGVELPPDLGRVRAVAGEVAALIVWCCKDVRSVLDRLVDRSSGYLIDWVTHRRSMGSTPIYVHTSNAPDPARRSGLRRGPGAGPDRRPRTHGARHRPCSCWRCRPCLWTCCCWSYWPLSCAARRGSPGGPSRCVLRACVADGRLGVDSIRSIDSINASLLRSRPAPIPACGSGLGWSGGQCLDLDWIDRGMLHYSPVPPVLFLVADAFRRRV